MLRRESTQRPAAYPESRDEDAEGVQHGQTHLGGNVPLQQRLVEHVSVRVGVTCTERTTMLQASVRHFTLAHTLAYPIRYGVKHETSRQGESMEYNGGQVEFKHKCIQMIEQWDAMNQRE